MTATSQIHSGAPAGAARELGRKRIDGIDFWRGFVLISIFINHVPLTVFGKLTHRNFGFSDAAEAFIFLSGVSVALAYGPRFFDGRTAVTIKAVLKRALTLYWVQLLLSVLAIAIFVTAAAILDEDEFRDEDGHDVLFDDPWRAIPAIVALTHQLGYINILPVYILFLMLTPALLALAGRSQFLMLGCSIALYAVARIFSLNIPTWPDEGGWFFNPLCWQLLFVTGIFIGLNLRTKGVPFSWPAFIIAALAVAASAVINTDGFSLMPGLWDRVTEFLDHDKTDLGLVRLGHFLALAYVLYHSGLTLVMRATPVFAPLSLIGRYSLTMFALGSVLAMLGQVIMARRPEDGGPVAWLMDVAVIGIGIALHYALAWYLDSRARARRAAAETPSLQPALPETGAVKAVPQQSHSPA